MDEVKKTSLRKEIAEFCDELWPDEEILLFGRPEGDPCDRGFLGVGQRINQPPVAIYDRDQCIEALAEEFATNTEIYDEDEDADPYTDAVEFFSFNTERAYAKKKKQTPIIIARFTSQRGE